MCNTIDTNPSDMMGSKLVYSKHEGGPISTTQMETAQRMDAAAENRSTEMMKSQISEPLRTSQNISEHLRTSQNI
eukprot:SAG31_NODE_1958_length_6814_cov_3.386597_9_plen_74_part_01